MLESDGFTREREHLSGPSGWGEPLELSVATMLMACGPHCHMRPPGEPLTDQPMFPRSLSVWTVWVSLSSGNLYCPRHYGYPAHWGRGCWIHRDTPNLAPWGRQMSNWGHGPSPSPFGPAATSVPQNPHVPSTVECTVVLALYRPLLMRGWKPQEVGASGERQVTPDGKQSLSATSQPRGVPQGWLGRQPTTLCHQ